MRKKIPSRERDSGGFNRHAQVVGFNNLDKFASFGLLSSGVTCCTISSSLVYGENNRCIHAMSVICRRYPGIGWDMASIIFIP